MICTNLHVQHSTLPSPMSTCHHCFHNWLAHICCSSKNLTLPEASSLNCTSFSALPHHTHLEALVHRPSSLLQHLMHPCQVLHSAASRCSYRLGAQEVGVVLAYIPDRRAPAISVHGANAVHGFSARSHHLLPLSGLFAESKTCCRFLGTTWHLDCNLL
jgi:hypothetical protein